MGDVHPWLSSGLPVDNGSNTSSGSNEWQEPGCSGTPSESKGKVGPSFIAPPHSMDSDSVPSMSDDLARQEVLVPL